MCHAREGQGGGGEGQAGSASMIAAEIEQRLLLLPGRANQSERNRLNRELRALSELPSPLPLTQSLLTKQHLPQLIEHWKLLHGPDAGSIAGCVRCGTGSASRCRFHPDAKAFAFGTGRFDYAYCTLWDTPHDCWFCCGGSAADCEGCCEEEAHSTDSEWWRAYAHLAPELQSDGSDADGESGDSSFSGVCEADTVEDMEIS